MIDGSTDTIVATVTGLGKNSVYMGVNTNTNKLYISAGDSGTTSIIDGGTNIVVQTLSTNTFYSAGVAVNPSTNLAYISDNQDNSVVILQGSTGSSQLTVSSQDTGGKTINGYYAVLYQSGNRLLRASLQQRSP